MSNYRSLAKMVSKQRLKQEAPSTSATGEESGADSGDKSFFSKQKMLESRIEKLRSLESMVKGDTRCSKKSCPVSLDPRTTQERFGNDSSTLVGTNGKSVEEPLKDMRERIDRFRTS